MNKIEPRLLKGFRDFGLVEQGARQAMLSSIQNEFERFGFLPLATPVLEYKDILMGKYGEDEKLIYNFTDKGEREVAMRYDLTVPLARYVAQNRNTLTFPFKRYQIAPVWRADNPQKGRLREFYQCDVDAVGTDSVLADAEVIACLCKAIESVGVTDYRLRLNDRRFFSVFESLLQGHKAELSEIIRSIDKVDKIGVEGVIETLENKQMSVSVIDSVRNWLNLGTGHKALLGISKIIEASQEALVDEITKRTASLIELLKTMGVSESNIVFDPSIARGLDYYTSTVFEMILPNKPQYGSICSGGRYDNLVDQFSETSLPAVGGSIGIDRLIDALSELNSMKIDSTVKALVFNVEEKLQDAYLHIVTKLRDSGINAELYYSPVKLDKQFKYAEAKNIPYGIIAGQTELDTNTVQLKNLFTREQQELPLEQTVSFLKST